MDTDIKKSFEFIDPRQKRIYSKLKEIGPGPAAFFRDACRLKEEKPPLESQTHLIAHLLREIESSVRDVMLPLDFKPSAEAEKKKQTQKEEIQAILELHNIDPDSEVAKLWLKIANQQEKIALHYLAHRNALERPREAGSSFDELWEGMQALLDILLNKNESNYLSFISILDDLLAVKNVSKANVKTFKKKIPNSPVTYGYFFEKLDNPLWLQPLYKAEVFKNPPNPIIHPNEGTSYPIWPQAIYLKKMAQLPAQQSTVLSACLEIKTDNVRSKGDLLDIALLLPVEMSLQILEVTGEIDYWFGPEQYGKLIVRLAEGGKVKESLELANKLLSIIPDPSPEKDYGGYKFTNDPIAKIRDWNYEEILSKEYPKFVECVGLDAVTLLADQLETFIKLKHNKGKAKADEDYSEIWRSTIEENDEKHDHGIRDVLINGVRDACELLLTKNPKFKKPLILNLEKRNYSIFRRLILHLLRLFPDGSEEQITDLLLNEAEFSDEERLTHEYYLLAESHAKLLNEAQRKQIWEWINKGPTIDMDAYRARCKEAGVEPSEEKVKLHIKRWQMYHLIPFKEIDPDWKKFYEDLVTSVGEPEHPSLRSWSRGGSWGPTSLLSTDQIKSMKPEEVISHLKSWTPPSHDPLDVSREGTGREVTANITEEPDKWLPVLNSFEELDPTFVRPVFVGYRDAVRNGKKFDWKPILELCKVILDKPLEVKERTPSTPFGDDPDWSWSRNSIAELIKEGLAEKEGKIPIELRKDTWSIIEELTNDSDPTPEKETEYLKSHPDPMSSAINSTRGDAMETAFQYGIWLKNNALDDKKDKWSLEVDAPELNEVLLNHLDIKIEPSLGIRAIYGSRIGQLGWLDLKWLKTHHNLIFPTDSKLGEYFSAAWEAYMTYGQAYYELYETLKPHYVRAIKEVGSHSDSKHHTYNPDQCLSYHLISFYCRGLISLENDLLTDFYKIASVELKSEVIDYIGRNAKKNPEMSPDIQKKFVSLLEHRLSQVKEGDNIESEIQEFENFSWWLASEKFDNKWVLDRLYEIAQLGCDFEGEHLIIERFVELAPQFPLEAIRCSNLIVQNDKKGWGIPHWGDQLYEIIKIVMEGGNEEAKTEATEFIHRLGALGHLRFKDLLSPGKS